MKIALAQMAVRPGFPEVNFATIKSLIEQAKHSQVDLIIFPEMAVSGYLLGDRWLDDDWCQFVHSFNDQIKALSKGIGIIWGNLFYGSLGSLKKSRDGRQLRLNAAFFAYQQQWVEHENGNYPGLYVKHLNPDYRFFDDSRYFLSGLEIMIHEKKTESPFISPFLFKVGEKQHRIGLEVCEDLWSEDYSYDITAEWKKKDLDILINVSASPWTLNKEIARHRHLANKATIPLVYVNQVGMQNTGKNVLVFDGDSCLYSPGGKRLWSANDRFEQELLITDLMTTQTGLKSPSHSKLLDALLYAIQSFDGQIFNAKIPWLIGLSGGIDSSLSAALLVTALGSHRVIGYNLATGFNSSLTKQNASHVAKQLGIRFKEGHIQSLVMETERVLNNQFSYSDIPLLANENIQARIRGHLLTSFAQIEGGIVVNNGNKLEVALGYCTLYGDTIGALAPLGDLTKLQIAELAIEINRMYQKEIVPTNLIPQLGKTSLIEWQFAPSAELKENQKDPMKWGYHDWLINWLMTFPTRRIETFMEQYLTNQLDDAVRPWIEFYGLTNPQRFIDDLEWVLKNLQNSVYKRIQMPPIVTVSRGAFGSDYRETQHMFSPTHRYEKLKQQILNKK